MIKAIFSDKVEKTSLNDIGRQASESGLKGWYGTYYHIQWAEIWSCLGSWVEEAKPEFGPRTGMNFEFVKNMDREKIAEAVRQRGRTHFSLLNEFLGPERSAVHAHHAHAGSNQRHSGTRPHHGRLLPQDAFPDSELRVSGAYRR